MTKDTSEPTSMSVSELVAERDLLREALASLGDMHLVQGDVAKFNNPHANVNLNTSAAWIVCKTTERSAHKIRRILQDIEFLRAVQLSDHIKQLEGE